MVGEGCGEGWGRIRPMLTVFRKREDRKMLKCFAQAGRFSELFSKLSCWPFGLELYSKHFKLPFFFFRLGTNRTECIRSCSNSCVQTFLEKKVK